ncbi:carboxylesterase family protein [Saccharibacillus kuerlensis]|uniref:Carboxylic ester hydrolase n=1 Tax=Saccharibacillus kuerlensis TaxID=459527 RepID=A0ABQ2L030_9BACL|nr:carboxylesterase family protein [Saccharibacillus kuerlensis]GGN98244.1 carboxylic ester hydrolase [Saccharibacillus kuerlensis]
MKSKKWGALLLSPLLAAGVFSVYSTPNQTFAAISTSDTSMQAESGHFTGQTLQRTQFGQVQGYRDQANRALVWQGIPYAASTAGAQRWKAPSDPAPWSGVLDATKPGSVAIQASGSETVGTEDALNLDIYRPDHTKEKLPVIVYIHGGNNQTGKSTEITGNSMVNDTNAVFVSVNYRLGPLGFNPLPALKTGTDEENSGNYALLDIAKSLDWVKANIEQFGGDPDNVTVAGFSAGGRDVMAMLISPLFEGKFDKAISFSGGMTIADEDASAKTFAKAIAPLAVADGKKATEQEAYDWLLTTGSDVRDYLYAVPAEKLAKLMSGAGIRMSVFPHLYADGTVLPKEGFDTKNYNDVPLLMLTGANEFSLFGRYDAYFAKNVADNSINTDHNVMAKYNFINKYGGELYGLFNVQDSAQKMFGSYGADIYGMQIDFGSDAYVSGSDMSPLGAFHGVFVPLLSPGNTNYESIVGSAYDLPGAVDLGKTFRKYISNFVRSGDPNGGGLTQWKTWTPQNALNGESMLILDANRRKAISYLSSPEFTYEQVLAAMRADRTISEADKAELISKVLNGRWFSGKLDQRFGNPSLWVK